jgi:hypothetical protein
MAYNDIPVQPELATASIAEATRFYIGLALANSALRIALSVASILGTATTSAACTHAEGLPTTAVTGAEPTVSPTTINSTVPESAAPTKGGDLVSTATINRVFFELSTVYTDGNKDRSLAVKVYGVDSALSKYSLPKTYLIPCAGSYLFGKDASFGQMCYFHIGTTRIGFTLQTLSQTGPGGAEVLVDVARLPEPDYVFGV